MAMTVEEQMKLWQAAPQTSIYTFTPAFFFHIAVSVEPSSPATWHAH